MPLGGEDDKTPPKIISISPKSGTVNFKEDKVIIKFDKYIQEETFEKSLVITPPTDNSMEINWGNSGKDVEIKFLFQENKTYAISIGSSTTDISGNKLLKQEVVRFSTGLNIDSGRIEGQVINDINKRVTIFCFKYDTKEPNPILDKPDYIALPSSEGIFSIEGLPLGKYRIYAIADEFNDMLYSIDNDAFGCASSDVNVVSMVVPTKISLIKLRRELDIKPPELFSTKRIDCSLTELKFSEPISEISINVNNFELINNNNKIQILNVWKSKINPFSIIVEHGKVLDGSLKFSCNNLADTALNLMPDSLGISISNEIISCNLTPFNFYGVNEKQLGLFTNNDTLLLSFNCELNFLDDKNAVVLKDSNTRKLVPLTLVKISPSDFYAYLSDSIPKFKKPLLEIDLRLFEKKNLSKSEKKNIDTTIIYKIGFGKNSENGKLTGSINDESKDLSQVYCVVARSLNSGKNYF